MGMDGLDRSSGRLDAQQDTVDKIPQILRVTDNTFVTNDTVQMGDNQSLATWATTNTGHGRTINRQRRGDGGNNMNAVVSSSNATINTSIAVRRNEDDDDPSIMTFTTAAGTSAGESAIGKVMDSISTFTGGNSGSGTGGRLIVSRDNKSGDTIRTRPEACFVHHIGRICSTFCRLRRSNGMGNYAKD